MSHDSLDPSACPVAAVCDKQVRIYGPLEPGRLKGREVRKLLRVINFRHHGAALQYAAEHDDRSRTPPTNRRAK